MLRLLHIENIAVIEQADILFESSPESPDTAQSEKVTISPSGMARSFR